MVCLPACRKEIFQTPVEGFLSKLSVVFSVHEQTTNKLYIVVVVTVTTCCKLSESHAASYNIMNFIEIIKVVVLTVIIC